MMRLLAALSCGTLLCSGASQRVVQDGVAVELELRTVDSASGATSVTLRVTDAVSGTPIDGAKPRAWFSRRLSEAVATERSCIEKIASFAGGLLSARADADLNRFVIATLNHDKTVTFLDPFVASKYKLMAAVELKANGFDWLYAPALDRIFVSMPDANAVAGIDASTFKLISNIELGNHGKSGRLALSPDGKTVWTSLDGSTQVAVIDGAALSVKGYANVGAGIHNFAFSPVQHTAYVSNSLSSDVSVVAEETLKIVSTVKVDQTPIALAWVPMAQMVYVASLNGDRIVGIDPESNQIAARIQTGRGVTLLHPDPTGRYLVALNQMAAQLILIDTAVNKVIGIAQTPGDPDQVAFAGRFAYVRSLDSDSITLVDLSELRTGKSAPLNIQVSRAKPNQLPDQITAAAMIAATPEVNSIVVANAPDAAMYFYKEGQMASEGNLSNYARQPRGILVVDRSLRAIEKGVFTAPVRIASGGRFDVAVAVDDPKVRQCFEVSLPKATDAADPKGPTQWLASPVTRTLTAIPSTPVMVRFQVIDSYKMPVKKGRVQILAFEPPGRWQERQWAEIGPEGKVDATQVFPHAGHYVVQLLGFESGVQLQSTAMLVDVASQGGGK